MAETALLNLYVAYKSYKLILNDLNCVVTAAKKFERTLKNEIKEHKDLLVEVHYDVLVKLKFAFKELAKLDAFFVGAHDRIFKNGLSLTNTPQSLTKLFEEFIKGITYFRQQLDPRHPFPVYHRLHSCGPNNKDLDGAHRAANLTCPGGLPRSEKARRKVLTERCYVERLIYDALFKHYTLLHPDRGNAELEQDERHIERLMLVEQDFRSCFRNMRVEVEMRFESGYPTRLEVKKIKKDELVSTEIYVKSLGDLQNKFCVYEPGVFCKRIVHSTGNVFAKINIFDMEQDWKRAHIDIPLVVNATVLVQVQRPGDYFRIYD